MAMLFDTGIFSVVGLDSLIEAGWSLGFFAAGTTTEVNTFTDSTLTTANTNPVIAAASGRFPEIWLAAGSYKYVLYDPDGVSKVTVDDYVVSADAPTIAGSLNSFLAGTAALAIANGGTGQTTAANAIAALGGVAKSGDTLTGNLVRNTKGAHVYFNAAGITTPEIFITASAASDPRGGLPGQLWFKY